MWLTAPTITLARYARDQHGLQPRSLRQERRDTACFGPSDCEGRWRIEQDPRHAEPDRRKEKIGEEMPRPAQRHKHRQAHEMPERSRGTAGMAWSRVSPERSEPVTKS